jgi:AraC-like DNA-binding protein
MLDAKLFIEANYLESIDIDMIASEACVSKFHFIRLFRQMYGITPHKFLSHLRIERAKELLEEGATISKTCYLLGFTSLSSFNKLFRQYLDVSPSFYQQQLALRRSMPLTYIPHSYVLYMGWYN